MGDNYELVGSFDPSVKTKKYEWRHPSFDIDGWAFPRKDDSNRYGWRCQHPFNLRLGKFVDVGCFTYMNAQHGIMIGEGTMIGSHCSIYSVNTENGTHGPVVIGKNCKIGCHSVILPNVVLKDGCKIPAFSLLVYCDECKRWYDANRSGDWHKLYHKK